LKHLINVTNDVGKYRLVFKQGEPFLPVNLRVHGDPISIIGKILDQNPRSYTEMNDFIQMGKDMVKAGLTVREPQKNYLLARTEIEKQLSAVEKRVVSMCIDAALAEDDFETAYSFIVTRLKDIGGPAHARAPAPVRTKPGLIAELPAKSIDDWSWRAALQAGKYRRNAHTVKATHLGNASGNLEIRHLEQRMDCLAQALRLAPRSTLQEILNVYRRCEEELESHAKQEAEQEAAWDAQVDSQIMPGGFAATPAKKIITSRATSHTTEESPVSLFDLSRESISRAQSGFSALSMFRGKSIRPNNNVQGGSSSASHSKAPSSAVLETPLTSPDVDRTNQQETIRKRDQLRNAAANSLASGVGWLIGAPPVHGNNPKE